MISRPKKKAPRERGASSVEAGFIQARNLSSSGSRIRNRPRCGKSLFPRAPGRAAARRGPARRLAGALAGAALALLAAAGAAAAEPAHGIAMHGEPALSRGFAHLPYANPEAPRGGAARYAETGGFDSLNPFVLKGRAPWAVSALTVETLMARSWDEPFTLYGLLAESVETPPDRSWVAFTLREEARFSDGSPVTVEDVMWSIRTLGEEGHPRYRAAWNAVESMRATGPRSVRIDFAEPNRELPLIMGLRPILKKAQFGDRPFAESSMAPLTGSGPYTVADAEPGRHVTFRRDPDWWGRDLPVNAGRFNYEEIRFDYYRDGDALWSAVRTGGVSVFVEGDPVRWAEGYDFPAAREGRLLRGEIPHGRPTGMYGFVFNTRRAPLDDRRVRRALALAFDWAWINDRLYRGAYERITSYYANSELAFEGRAEGRERALLAPFADTLPEGTLETGWRPPRTDGTGRDRRALRRAGRLLDRAGWRIENGRRVNAAGEALALEVLVASGEHETLASLWAQSLRRIGITLTPRRVDDAQFESRRRDYDYDITVNRWWLSLSPGTEQWLYWGSQGREEPGTRNYMGVASEAVDAMIEAMLAAETRDGFAAAVRALDRVLTSGVHVVPFGFLPADRVAWRRGHARPERPALYGYRPEVWWREPARRAE
jgi:peptide/nickel transport system substrate-binding protein